MPELPDVEHFRRRFDLYGRDRRILGTWADPSILRNATPRAIGRVLLGHRLLEPDRVGKWLIARTVDGSALLLHFGMTGEVVSSREVPDRHRHDRLVLHLDDGTELRYRNMRKLGGAWLAHDDGEVEAILGGLGPDALAITSREFLDRLQRRRGSVKAALMDQHFLAGMGNLVADEVLWQARLHPKRAIESLTAEERRRLVSVSRSVLREAVDRYDYLPRKRSWLSHVRGERGALCPRCGTPLSRAVVGGRTTYFCPRCQPAA